MVGIGAGLLVGSEKSSDGELAQKAMTLLGQPWQDDGPGGETWNDVLLEGCSRGARHCGRDGAAPGQAFLLDLPATQRIIRFLVPYLADKKTTKAGLMHVCGRPVEASKDGPV